MSIRWSALVVLVVVLPRVGSAEPPHRELEAPSAAEDEALYSCKNRTGPVAVTFKPDTELKDLLTWVMGFTCKNFVLDPRIVATGKKITLISPEKMSASDAYRVFLVALATIGLTVVPKGNVMRVVDAANAKHDTLPIFKRVPDDAERMVRVVIRPSHAQPEALRQAFASVKSDVGDIVVIGSALVVTDYASSVNGMISLQKLVDVPGGTDGIYTLPVHHGEAAKVAQMLTAMFSTNAPALKPGEANPANELAPSKILVDERTNTLVISATESAYLRAKALVDRIDVAIDMEGGGSIHTYQLANAIADDVAQTLTSAIGGQAAPRTQKPAGPVGGAQVPQGAPASTPPASAPLDGLGAALQGSVHVVADKSTNKLLITSSARDFFSLKEVIQELDQPRRQVYLEAMILEVDVTNGLNFGASVHGGQNVNGSDLGFGGVQLPELSSLDPASALGAGGLVGGLLGAPLASSLTLLGKTIPSYGVLFQALATYSTTNILSTPYLIALDNEDAKSKIGEDIPFLRGVVPVAPGSTQTTTNVDRKPLELELNVKPHISANDTVLLEIKHSAGNIKDASNPLGPTWSTRSVETRAVVRDQQTVLIGGLMQDTEIDRESKVPLLGDIPLLGHLFKYTRKSKHKTNLLIMLTPYIIKEHGDLERIRQRKLRQNEEFFHSFSHLESMRFESQVDYHRKRGLIEEINRSVQSVQDEAAARARVAPPPGVSPGPIEIPSPVQ